MESSVAILLRKRKFSDTSLIVSWCTESLGCIQTVAKGARRAKSPFAGRLDLFFEVEIQVARSRRSDLHTLTEVVLKNPFGGIRKNYLSTQTAAYFVELIEIARSEIIGNRNCSYCCTERLAISMQTTRICAQLRTSRPNSHVSQVCTIPKY